MRNRSPIEQFRPAMDAADKSGLPQTVFYHPDWGFAHTNPFATILSDKKTERFVTWLPERFFVR